MQLIFMLGVNGYLIITAKKARICMGYLYSNASHIMPCVSDIYRCVPSQISNVSGDISWFKLIGTLNTYSLILRKNCIWDTLDINWSQRKVLVNNQEVRLPLLSP